MFVPKEMALTGLRKAIELSLPNSLAFVITDASAKDYTIYDEVAALIQTKQITVNFLLTGSCGGETQPDYLVYRKLARISNGQMYSMQKTEINDVFSTIRQSIMSNNTVLLKSVDVELPNVMTTTDLRVDKSVNELSLAITGKNPTMVIRDPSNNIITSGDSLVLTNLKLTTIKNPRDGIWKIETKANSAHSLKLSALSDLKFEFGFSLNAVDKISETAFQPLAGYKNVLSIFITGPSLIRELLTVEIITVPLSPSETPARFSLALQKRNENLYLTNEFDIASKMFKIQLNGIDVNGNVIERLISTALVATHGSKYGFLKSICLVI